MFLIKSSPPYSSPNTYTTLNIIAKGAAHLAGSAITDFNARAVINLDRLAPLAGDATITKDIITSRVKSLGEVSSRDLGLILIEIEYS